MSHDREDRWDALELEEFAEERRASRRRGCACGDDLPGHCPGPASCPYSGEGKSEEEGDDGAG